VESDDNQQNLLFKRVEPIITFFRLKVVQVVGHMFREGMCLHLEGLRWPGSGFSQHRMSHSHNLIKNEISVSLAVRNQMAKLITVSLKNSGTQQYAVQCSCHDVLAIMDHLCSGGE
jgi:hypothetical protein